MEKSTQAALALPAQTDQRAGREGQQHSQQLASPRRAAPGAIDLYRSRRAASQRHCRRRSAPVKTRSAARRRSSGGHDRPTDLRRAIAMPRRRKACDSLCRRWRGAAAFGCDCWATFLAPDRAVFSVRTVRTDPAGPPPLPTAEGLLRPEQSARNGLYALLAAARPPRGGSGGSGTREPSLPGAGWSARGPVGAQEEHRHTHGQAHRTEGGRHCPRSLYSMTSGRSRPRPSFGSGGRTPGHGTLGHPGRPPVLRTHHIRRTQSLAAPRSFVVPA